MSDRPVRDCQHPKTFHPHGTRNAYVCDKCRCEPCTADAAKYNRDHNRTKAYGRYGGLVDAEPVRAHIRALSEAGVGLKTITINSGVSGGVLTKLVYGHPKEDGTRRPPSRRCTPSVRDRILAVTADKVAGGVFVDATGTRRRLQALVAIGWSQSKIAYRLGLAPTNAHKTFHAERVTVRTARAVAVLYDELWNTLPPREAHRDKIAYARALNLAAVKGWLPPLAWDDDTIDLAELPDVEVTDELDEIAVERIMAGTLHVERFARSAERIEAVRRLAALGYTDRQISERVRLTPSGVQRLRTRAQDRNKAA